MRALSFCRPQILAVGVAAALLLTAAPAAAQRSSADFAWKGVVLQGSAIEIKGVNGDVNAGPATGNEVEVTAVRKGRRSNPDDVRIEVVQHGEGVTICAVYPDVDGRPNECRAGNEGRNSTRDNDVTVHFQVRVPAGVRFIGRTVNGDVTAEKLQAPLSLRTVNGSATFSTSAYGDATTVNGSIKGSLGSSASTDGLKFQTVNGSITLDLPADTNADVRAKTVNGDISTDFPMTVVGRVTRRTLSGTIGSGGRVIELETVNGSVNLRRR